MKFWARYFFALNKHQRRIELKCCVKWERCTLYWLAINVYHDEIWTWHFSPPFFLRRSALYESEGNYNADDNFFNMKQIFCLHKMNTFMLQIVVPFSARIILYVFLTTLCKCFWCCLVWRFIMGNFTQILKNRAKFFSCHFWKKRRLVSKLKNSLSTIISAIHFMGKYPLGNIITYLT